mmetsp:Transcript_54501/g.90341  ORF Transcript_54501/g.90341 Transcript_54501/m.90341 type:complete len:217 (-) Transcript_54501:38-688(-)
MRFLAPYTQLVLRGFTFRHSITSPVRKLAIILRPFNEILEACHLLIGQLLNHRRQLFPNQLNRILIQTRTVLRQIFRRAQRRCHLLVMLVIFTQRLIARHSLMRSCIRRRGCHHRHIFFQRTRGHTRRIIIDMLLGGARLQLFIGTLDADIKRWPHGDTPHPIQPKLNVLTTQTRKLFVIAIVFRQAGRTHFIQSQLLMWVQHTLRIATRSTRGTQ